MPYLLFLKKRQIFNCRLLQIIGGALRVRFKLYYNMCNDDTKILPYIFTLIVRIGLGTRKPAFGLNNKVVLKPACSGTDAS